MTHIPDVVSASTRAAGDWQALHIFYAANPQPLLTRCIPPLIESLDADGLLAGHFFICYWLEGPHVRLRLRPSSPSAAAEVRRRTEQAVGEFLRSRPALYNVSSGFLSELYNTLFDMEYPDSERAQYLGPDGKMNVRTNNTFSWEPYEPEYGKYGGPAGVALAEWHFQHSSDLVTGALRTMNLHVRTVLLGTAAQLMMVMSRSFLQDEEELAGFLDGYYEFWQQAFTGTALIGSDEYDATFDAVGPAVSRRFREIRESIGHGDTAHLPGMLRGWAAHCLELRERVTHLARRGELTFRARDGVRERQVTEPGEALTKLLSPYLHMTNNRLHVTIRDEAYLAYVLGRSLRQQIPAGALT